ncbi:MAG: xanthine dehydrogenase small subunit, partial [Janthinobacterium lividum]
MADPAVIRFYHRGEIASISASATTRTVLQHLREDLACTGTKEGCAEGDCGACTVVIGELDNEQLVFKTVNACIQLLPTLDGRALFTVEDLKAADGSLHPVQQAMVECHGSQCGFCTPGFVMSLWGLYLKREAGDGEISGTGVAGGAGSGEVRGAAVADADANGTVATARSGRAGAAATDGTDADVAATDAAGSAPYAGAVGAVDAAGAAGSAAMARSADCRCEVDTALSGNLCRCTGYRPIIAAAQRMQQLPAVRFNREAVRQALLALRRTPAQALDYRHASQQFCAPATLDQLLKLRHAMPQAVMLAGCTDVGLWVTKQLRALPAIIYLGQVAELRQIRQTQTSIEIGAGVSLEKAYAAVCRHYETELGQFWQRFASLPIRNAGTLGGNLANGSPIGDSMPWLIALGARVKLRSATSARWLPLEALYLGYQRKDML